MAQILTLKRNYNPRQSRERRCDVRGILFLPSSLRIWLMVQFMVYFVIIIVEFLVTVLSIIYIFYFLKVDCPFKMSLKNVYVTCHSLSSILEWTLI